MFAFEQEKLFLVIDFAIRFVESKDVAIWQMSGCHSLIASLEVVSKGSFVEPVNCHDGCCQIGTCCFGSGKPDGPRPWPFVIGSADRPLGLFIAVLRIHTTLVHLGHESARLP